MISRVSVGVSFGSPSTGTSEPRTRIIGGAPAVMWRSDALRRTTSRRISEKSKVMAAIPSSASTDGFVRDSASARDAGDLGDRGEPAADLLQPVLAQAHHALVDGRVGDRLGGLAGHGERADGVADPHDLIQPDAALVAGAAAAGAAHGLVGLQI